MKDKGAEGKQRFVHKLFIELQWETMQELKRKYNCMLFRTGLLLKHEQKTYNQIKKRLIGQKLKSKQQIEMQKVVKLKYDVNK